MDRLFRELLLQERRGIMEYCNLFVRVNFIMKPRLNTTFQQNLMGAGNRPDLSERSGLVKGLAR